MTEDLTPGANVQSTKIHDKPKRPGGEKRGNSYARRARKQWLLSSSQFKRPEGSEGRNVFCTHCGSTLDYATVESDRKVPGGSYRRENIQPACRTCNLARSDNPHWVPANKV